MTTVSIAPARTSWPLLFRAAASGAAVVIALLLIQDPRSDSRLLIAIAIGSLALAAVPTRVRYALGGAVAYTGVAINTYEYGGLAFLMSTFLLVLSATTHRWPAGSGGIVRVAIALVIPVWFVSMIGPGLVLAPVLFPLLVWATKTAGRWTRHLFAFLAGVVASSGAGLVLHLATKNYGAVGPVMIGTLVAVYALFAFVIARRREPIT